MSNFSVINPNITDVSNDETQERNKALETLAICSIVLIQVFLALIFFSIRNIHNKVAMQIREDRKKEQMAEQAQEETQAQALLNVEVDNKNLWNRVI